MPTGVGGMFDVLFRFYGPRKPLSDKSSGVPDIDKVH